jgi:RimJ/RimL family protein N-acetyltransferase
VDGPGFPVAEVIPTKRLSLVPARLDTVRSEAAGRDALADELEVGVPESWPPELYDERARSFVMGRLEAAPSESGWWHYYVIQNEPVPTLVGIAGFKGPADIEGTVEMGYSIVPERQRLGIASEAVGALIDWAFETSAVRRIVAETYPTLGASIRVLEKLGFRLVHGGSEPGVVRYGLDRPPARS